MKIQWYPGHMARASREISESLSSVDIVAEIADARIPLSSRNERLDGILKGKPRIVVLNREDLAVPGETGRWISRMAAEGTIAFACNSKTGAGIKAFPDAVHRALREQLARREEKGLGSMLIRVMVVGIPNSGKSSFINRLSGGRPATAEDRPGVTRKNQWYRLPAGFALLDTPGILPPKLDPPEAGLHLAFTGAIKDEILDTEALSAALLARLSGLISPDRLEKFGISGLSPEEPHGLLRAYAKKRGVLQRGGEPDTERAALMLLDDFRLGKAGRITLEPADYEYGSGVEDDDI